MIDFLKRLTDWIFKGGNVTYKEAILLSEINKNKDIISLISFANIIRDELKGADIDFYSNMNVKTDDCREDCNVCFQSDHYDIDSGESLKVQKEIVTTKAKDALKMGVNKFNIVFCSGNIDGRPEDDNIYNILKTVSPGIDIECCASLGMLRGEDAPVFIRFGIEDDNNNLDTAESLENDIEKAAFFNEKIYTLEAARAEGYRICSGVTCGTGESPEQRIILAFALREFDVDSILLQFSAPVKNKEPLSPFELLKIIAIYRFIHPHKDIIIGGKRWNNFKTVKPIIHLSGANGVMIGNYLTGTRKSALEGIKTINDLLPVN